LIATFIGDGERRTGQFVPSLATDLADSQSNCAPACYRDTQVTADTSDAGASSTAATLNSMVMDDSARGC
jgi:hypothetical protein